MPVAGPGGRILVEQLPDGHWILREPLRWDSHEVKAQFLTDYGSVPRLLWWWVSPTDYPLARAFLLHDARYEDHAMTRREADALLYECAVACGTRRSKAWCVWAAVRLFGGRAYATGPARQRERLRAYAAQVGA